MRGGGRGGGGGGAGKRWGRGGVVARWGEGWGWGGGRGKGTLSSGFLGGWGKEIWETLSIQAAPGLCGLRGPVPQPVASPLRACSPRIGEDPSLRGQYLCPQGGGHHAPLLRGAGPCCSCQGPWGPPRWAWGAGCSRGYRHGASARVLGLGGRCQWGWGDPPLFPALPGGSSPGELLEAGAPMTRHRAPFPPV